jgi:hypothetical protein
VDKKFGQSDLGQYAIIIVIIFVFITFDSLKEVRKSSFELSLVRIPLVTQDYYILK